MSALSLNGKSVSGLATLAGWKSAGVRHALRAHGGPKRTDFKRRQAISLDPSITLALPSLIASIMRVVGFQRHQPPRRYRVCVREPLRDPIAYYSLLNHSALTYATNAASVASVVW